MPLDPRIILAQRPLESLSEMQDQRAQREIQQQEVELRRQEIMARRDAIIEAQQRRNQPAAAAAVDPKKEFDLRLAKAQTLANLLENADETNYPVVRGIAMHIIGEDAGNELPEQFDPVKVKALAALGKQQIAAQTRPQLVETVGADGKTPVRKAVTLKEGDEYPMVPKATTSQAANLGSFEDYVTRTYGENPTPAQILEGRKKYNQSDDRPPVSVTVGGGALAATGGLDPDGLALAAAKYRLTGQTISRDSKQNAAVLNEAAKQAKVLGNSPAQTIQRQAAYKGDAAALAQMRKASSSAEAFESKAIAQTGIIRDLSKKVPRTAYPIINAALQSGRTEITGNADATMLANAVETFSEEYAKIMGGSTGSSAGATDSSRAAAKRLINTAMSNGTMDKVLDLMQREMDLTMQGYDATIGHITERMGGTSQGEGNRDPLGIR